MTAIQQTPSNSSRMLKLEEVCKITGLSRVTIYELIKNPQSSFPEQVKLTPNGRASRWLSDEVYTWLQKCANAREEV